MKKALLSMVAVALLFTACNEDSKDTIEPQEVVDMSDFYLFTDADSDEASKSADKSSHSRNCHAMVNLNRQLKENPGLQKKMYDIEYHTRKNIVGKGKPPKGGGGQGGGSSSDVDVLPIQDNLGIINIPVYVHVIYPDANSISNAQVTSQMNVLNDDFRDINTNQLPSGTTFVNDATDAGFSFSLAGTFRHNDSKSSWGTNDSVKNAYPPITPETLNFPEIG